MPMLQESGAAIRYTANIGGYGSRRSRGRHVEESRQKNATSILLLAEGGAEGMAGINADNAEFARKEFQLLQCKGEALVVGMAIDVGVELRGEEVAVDHVAFELGHVDAVGGEAAHRLVERRGQVAHPENKRGDQRPRPLLGPIRLARQHHETRGVVSLVLDVLAQYIEAVDFGGQPRGNRRRAPVAALGDIARAAGGVGSDDRLWPEL